MSNFKEAEMPFPWIPILIVLSALVLFMLTGRWLFQYATYLWANSSHRHGRKKKKSRHSTKRKKAKYSDSDSSSESSDDSSE
jgi:hypothetical protein